MILHSVPCWVLPKLGVFEKMSRVLVKNNDSKLTFDVWSLRQNLKIFNFFKKFQIRNLFHTGVSSHSILIS
jgi:hypothetical protein